MAWPGTFKPSDLGISDYDFITNFARHFPGGGVGDPDRQSSCQHRPCEWPYANHRRTRNRLPPLATKPRPLATTTPVSPPSKRSEFSARRPPDAAKAWGPSPASAAPRPSYRRSMETRQDRHHPTCPPSATTAPDSMLITTSLSKSPAAPPPTTVTTATPPKPRSATPAGIPIPMSTSAPECFCVDIKPRRNGLDHMVVRVKVTANPKTVPSPIQWVDLRGKMLPPRQRRPRRRRRQETRPPTTPIGTYKDRYPQLSRLPHERTPRFPRLDPQRHAAHPLRETFLHRLSLRPVPRPFPTKPSSTPRSPITSLFSPPLLAARKPAPIIIEPIFLRSGKSAYLAGIQSRGSGSGYWAHLKDGKVTPMLPAEAAKTENVLNSRTGQRSERDPDGDQAASSAKKSATFSPFQRIPQMAKLSISPPENSGAR